MTIETNTEVFFLLENGAGVKMVGLSRLDARRERGASMMDGNSGKRP